MQFSGYFKIKCAVPPRVGYSSLPVKHCKPCSYLTLLGWHFPVYILVKKKWFVNLSKQTVNIYLTLCLTQSSNLSLVPQGMTFIFLPKDILKLIFLWRAWLAKNEACFSFLIDGHFSAAILQFTKAERKIKRLSTHFRE